MASNGLAQKIRLVSRSKKNFGRKRDGCSFKGIEEDEPIFLNSLSLASFYIL